MALAFVDDSGSGGDSPYYVLAGYVAGESTWAGFVPDWQAVLDCSPRLEYFKMNEAEMLTGQFAGFSSEERDARLDEFIDVVLKCDPWEASVAVPAKEFQEVLRPVLLKSHDNPYYSAFIAMVTAFSGIYRWSGYDETVDFIFDEQAGMQNKMHRLYQRFRHWYPNWRLGRVGFNSDKKVLPLQAADLIAWQTRRFMCSREGTRTQFKRLHSRRQAFRKILKRRELQEMADAISENLPRLREEYGDAKVDSHLSAIERRNLREASKISR
jgi:hypothetical protein